MTGAITTGHRRRARGAEVDIRTARSASINMSRDGSADSAGIRIASAANTYRSVTGRGRSTRLSGARCTGSGGDSRRRAAYTACAGRVWSRSLPYRIPVAGGYGNWTGRPRGVGHGYWMVRLRKLDEKGRREKVTEIGRGGRGEWVTDIGRKGWREWVTDFGQ